MAPSSARPLRGSCDCGRNQYLIVMPAEPSPPQLPSVCFDEDSAYLRSTSTPISVFLRVPLPWLHSTTYAFYPSETHAQIRRSYVPHHSPHSKRYFCGHCATTLSVWSEERPEEADWVCVNWHSLENQSKELLDELGVLPGDDDDEEAEQAGVEKKGAGGGAEVSVTAGGRSGDEAGLALMGSSKVERGLVVDDQGKRIRGQPWFEEMLEGSELGRIRRRRGGKTSADGKQSVEWEIMEYEEGSGEGAVSGFSTRRKIEQAGDDVAMSGAH